MGTVLFYVGSRKVSLWGLAAMHYMATTLTFFLFVLKGVKITRNRDKTKLLLQCLVGDCNGLGLFYFSLTRKLVAARRDMYPAAFSFLPVYKQRNLCGKILII